MHDLILVHPPSVLDFRARRQFRGPIAEVIPSSDQFDMFAVGLTSIAAYVATNGYRVRIVNVGRRMVAEPTYDPVGHLERLRSKVFGISLHWLPHAQGALAIARLLKRLHPDSLVLLGGLSATYYHEELIRDPVVDFVLRGDSTEEPSRQLLSALRRGAPLGDVENLTWKGRGGSPVVNPLSWSPSDIDAVELPAYRYMLRAAALHGHLADLLPYDGWWQEPLTVLINARGCVLECATCGGSASAYRRLCGRTSPAYRSADRLLSDLRTIRSFSRSPVFMVHDPRMGGESRAARFFDGLARERMPNELVLELFWPADEAFFRRLSGAVDRWSLQLTLDSHDEALRARNGKFGCTNEEIEATIGRAFEAGCRNIDVFLTIGVPGQTLESALAGAGFCERLLARFGSERRLRVFAAPIAPFLDPGSRAFEDAALGYRPLARTVADHERALLEPDWASSLTYHSDAMTRDEIVEATYGLTERINDLNLRFGLSSQATHDAVASGIAAARAAVTSAETGPRGTAWMFAKDEMNWPGAAGIRPTPRLAWILLTGLVDELRLAVDRALGRYDRRVAVSPAVAPSAAPSSGFVRSEAPAASTRRPAR
ncbi:MAG: TIGR04190 family B12-binding domain/radical SAM domain protein [Chloroflexi bacterium]|nr:TIGR04190 family B12-binding domain/radical SAM domain protein [Chloroflexota bacterium]